MQWWRTENYLCFLSELLLDTVFMVGHNPEKLADTTTYYSLSYPLLTLLWMLLFPRSEGPAFTLTSSRFTCHMGASTWKDGFSQNRNTCMCLSGMPSSLVPLKCFPLYNLHKLQTCIFFFLLPLKRMCSIDNQLFLLMQFILKCQAFIWWAVSSLWLC